MKTKDDEIKCLREQISEMVLKIPEQATGQVRFSDFPGKL
jgi:hypothetical protein